MRSLLISLFAILMIPSATYSQDGFSDLQWPREIELGKYIITLYQPQLENFEGNKLDGRMAVSIKADEELYFGAVWISSVVSTNTEDRIVTLEKVAVPKVHFPDLDDEERIKRFSEMLEGELESWEITMSLDRLIASMNDLDERKSNNPNLNNAPPKILYRTIPSDLISIDGDPILKKDDEFGIEYVVNTAFFIAKEKDSYYIKNGKFWLKSKEVLGPYEQTEKADKNIQKFADKYGSDIELDSIDLAMTKSPELIIVTEPAELISTDGDAEYSSIEGTGLLYATNTEDDIIMDIDSQEHYILIAGRWYHSKSLENGEWTFAEPQDLPEDFNLIPKDSDVANVRISIPNTDEAQDALLEQSIPQTAKVDRNGTTVEVSYDGDPQFEAITGTSMSYAVNTDKTVLLINKKYYCVDDAIWFVSDKATGPWVVSAVRPDEVDDIPAESPVYNVKYVYIYDSTPEVVYVGYYPGYTYSYVYGGVVVYGTGYYYPYWYGTYYYPRPVTYGYGVHYSPYSGWGFSYGISVGWSYHRYGYWGSRGYRYGYRRGYNRGHRRGYNRGYNRGYSQGAKAGYTAGKRSNSNNVYSNRGNSVSSNNRANASQANNKSGGNYQSKSQASNKQNNMYADKNGNVHQQNKDGSWENKNKSSNNNKSQASSSQTKQNNQSSQHQSNNKSSTQSKSNTSQQQLDNASQSRSRGNSNYNRSSSSRSSGGSRGGGGGRRR